MTAIQPVDLPTRHGSKVCYCIRGGKYSFCMSVVLMTMINLQVQNAKICQFIKLKMLMCYNFYFR